MKTDLSKLKVALVADWLTEVGGAENVLIEVAKIFPDAPIFTSQFREKFAPKFFAQRDIRTGWMNIFPRKLRKFLSPLRYVFFAHLDLREFDLVISINNAEAKNLTRANLRENAVHVSYLQGPPTQYYWREYDRYIENPGFGKLNFLARIGLKILLKPMRKMDYNAAQKPDFLLANSTYVQSEIREFYGRESEVLFPPVDVKSIQDFAKKISKNETKKLREKLFDGEDFYMIAGRQVNWKRVDIAVDFAKKTGENLLILGDGAEHEKLVARAKTQPMIYCGSREKTEPKMPKNIKFLPRYDGAKELTKYLVAAKGFLFTSLEPFGITPVESLAVGTPVIAFAKGGARDFIDVKNGVFFDEQNVESLEKAAEVFAKKTWNKNEISRSAEKFSNANFAKNLMEILEEKI